MPITSLRITDFRNLEAIEFITNAYGLNFIYGNNGSGKTNLLEAIHYLSTGRSFRISTHSPLIRHSKERFSIFAQIESHFGQIPAGIERDCSGSLKMRIAEKDIASLSELTYLLPMRILNTHSHSLFEAGPIFRRKYLDWGLFYDTDQFLTHWRQFERVLKQRNFVLREKRSKLELEVWNRELVKYGLELDRLRRDYIKRLTPFLSEVSEELLGMSDFKFTYDPGWDECKDFCTILEHRYEEELRSGYTQFGPHRADFDIAYKTFSVKHILSRGQQKLLICGMILAQGRLLAKARKNGLIYLIDDLPAELDFRSRMKLISLLVKQETQIFVTAIEKSSVNEWFKEMPNIPKKMFHVEQGRMTEISD